MSIASLAVITLASLGSALSQAAIPRTGATITNGVTSITMSNSWGGAVVSYKYMGEEFINVNDPGRLMQFSSYCNKRSWTTFTSDGYTFNPDVRSVVNPNQAGDALGNPSFTFYVDAINPTTLESKCIPREWFTHDWPGLDANGGAQFDNCRMINRAIIQAGYSGKVTKLDLQLNPHIAGTWTSELPALYLLLPFDTFYGVNAVANTKTLLTTTGTTGTRYLPLSGIGGIIASANNNKSIGIYGATKANGGDIDTNFVCYTFTAANCTKLGVSTPLETLAAGQIKTYSSYIVTGDNPTQVQNIMRSMYVNGLR